MWEFLNLDPESIAEGESYKPGKGRERDIGDRIGDGLMSILTGKDYGALVEAAAKDDRTAAIGREYGSQLDSVAGLKGYSELTDLADMEDSTITREINKRLATQKARNTAAVTYGIDITKLDDLTDPGAIMSAAIGLKDEKDRETRNEERDYKEGVVEKERTHQLALTGAQNAHEASETNKRLAHEAAERNNLRAFETEQTNARLAHEANQNNLTRQYQADLAKHDANTKLQLGMMESADRRADRADAREDRLASQRQASIMALVKGLTQMGAGFAI